MKIFRTYLIQLAGTLMLLAGIGFYFLNPADRNGHHNVFASWLESHLVNPDDAALNQKLKEISYSTEEFQVILKKASKLIQNHENDFQLPVKKSPESEKETLQILISEWNEFQDFANGMGKAALAHNIKPHSLYPNGGLAFSGHFSPLPDMLIQAYKNDVYKNVFPLQDYQTAPFISGIAIGAP